MSKVTNRILKNTGWLYAKMAITMFLSLYTTRLILNGLGASDFGIYNIVGGAIAMLGFLNAAMAGATQRFMNYTEGAGDPEKKKTIFNVSVAIHGILAVIVGIALAVTGIILLNGVLNIPDGRRMASVIVYASMTVSTILTITTVPYDAVLNSHENMKYYALVGVVESFLKLTVAFVCVYSTYDKLIVYGILMACIPFLTLTVERIYCHTHYKECSISLKKNWDKKVVKEMTSFAGWNLFATAAAMITNSGIGIIMNVFFGTIINAAQGVANQICGQLNSVTTVLSKAVIPVITKSEGAADRNRTIRLAETSSKLLFFVMAIVAIPSLSTLPTLMNLWLKEVPEYAVYFASIQLLISMCEQLSSGFSTAINASGHIKGISISKSIAKFSYLPLSYIMYTFGISITVAYLFLFLIQGAINGILITQYYGYKILGYSPKRYLLKVFIPSSVPAFFTFLFGYYFSSFFVGIYSLVVAVVICSLLNITMFYFVSLTRSERMIVNNILQTIRIKLHI